MAFVVEDGTGLADANAYITEQFFLDWCADRGLDPGNGDPKAAIIRASAWLDATFGADYPGERVNGRVQGLLFPREGGLDADGNVVASDSVPIEMQKACAAASVREGVSAGALSPDQNTETAIKSERIGSLETVYAVADSAATVPPWFPEIAGLLAPLIGDKAVQHAAAWYWA